MYQQRQFGQGQQLNQQFYAQHQQQQLAQAQAQNGYPPQKQTLSNIDPTLLLGQYSSENIKEEMGKDFLNHQFDINMNGNINNADQLLSPLTPTEDFNRERSSNAGFGTSMPQSGFYSMSVPVHSNNGYPAVDQKNFLQHPSSFSSYGSPMGISNNSLPEEAGERQSIDAINEKRRKRRESHNAVERRRRDHINEKIQELSSLLPEFASDAQNKPNKGVILRRSVEYIRHMQLFAARQMDRTLELEQCLMRLCQNRGIDESELGLSMPLGTPIQLPALNQSNNLDLDGPDGDL
ncbi:hypothetical protein HDV04_005360 [Boothiomyces sp. JEL0838]|nr:hypothetical protein HDV04_005360 [Boothiomyces sp. JEL0838]